VVLALVIVPAMLVRYEHQLLWTFLIDLTLFAASSGSVLLFYREGQRWAGRPAPPIRELLAVLPVGVGMAVRNASAVIEGLFERGGYFKRTPKSGGKTVRNEQRQTLVAEAALAIFFAGTITAFAMAGYWTAIPFLSLFASGYALFALLNIRESAA
jgi:hypothetical protein